MQRAAPLVRRSRVLGIGLILIAVGIWAGWSTGRGIDPARRLARARDLEFDHQPEAAIQQVRLALAELGPTGDSGLRKQALTRAAQITDAQRGLSHTNEALGWYREIIRQFPKAPEAFDAGVRIADLLHERLADDVHAEQQLVAVVNAFPRHPAVEGLLLRAARSAIDGRRFDDALADANRILVQYGKSMHLAEAQSLIGEVLHLQGQPAEAARSYDLVAARWPHTEIAARALEEEGNCFAELGEPRRAVEKYVAALPDHPDPMSIQRSLERARRRLHAAQAIDPGSKAYAFGRD